jgi:hypothetical protein
MNNKDYYIWFVVIALTYGWLWIGSYWMAHLSEEFWMAFPQVITVFGVGILLLLFCGASFPQSEPEDVHGKPPKPN